MNIVYLAQTGFDWEGPYAEKCFASRESAQAWLDEREAEDRAAGTADGLWYYINELEVHP